LHFDAGRCRLARLSKALKLEKLMQTEKFTAKLTAKLTEKLTEKLTDE
jgi:hypothetical protein